MLEKMEFLEEEIQKDALKDYSRETLIEMLVYYLGERSQTDEKILELQQDVENWKAECMMLQNDLKNFLVEENKRLRKQLKER